MRRYARVLVGLALLGLLALSVVAIRGPGLLLRDLRRLLEPAFPWEVATPESLGLSAAGLEELWRDLEAKGTDALLVVKNDRIVFEWYAPDWEPEDRHATASLAKALVGGSTLMLAVCDGRVGLDDLASSHVPGWKDDVLRARVSLRHLATHSSGLPHARKRGQGGGEREEWEVAYWSRDPDPFTLTLSDAPLTFPPGTDYAYSGPAFAVLSYAVTAGLRDAPERDLRSLLAERMMKPLGVPGSHWSIGYGSAYEVDGMKLYASWGGASFSARAAARVGQLLAHRGEWQGQRLLERDCVEAAVRWSGTPQPEGWLERRQPLPALGWWSNAGGSWPTAPRDAFAGLGADHQVLLVVPSLDLVVVRYGDSLGEDSWGGDYWIRLERDLLDPLMGLFPESGSEADRGGGDEGLESEDPPLPEPEGRGEDDSEERS